MSDPSISPPRLTHRHLEHISKRPQLPLLPHPHDKPPPPDGSRPDPRNVQGDVYLTFTRDWESLLFFEITNTEQFVKDLFQYEPTTSFQVMHDTMRKLAEAKAAGQRAKLSHSELAFTRAGLDTLGHTEPVQDAYFDVASHPNPAADEPFRSQVVHGVFFIAASDKDICEEGVQRIKSQFKHSIAIPSSASIEGHSRPGENRGHEHFGYKAGISQPALRGMINPLLGQPQCDPGVIIMGYPGDPLYNAAKNARPEWTKDGSLMVFRKLQQKVPEFKKYVADAGPRWREWMPKEDVDKMLPPLSSSEGVALFGARLFGRWMSGAPIPRAPYRDDLSQTTKERIQDFDFAVPGVYGPSQSSCPFTAHIRKTAPRNLDPFASKEFLEMSLIVRSGIPYGPEVEVNETQTRHDRGLLFICYQSSIVNGFGTQTSWAHNDYFPVTWSRPTKWGQDSVLGLTPPPKTIVQVTTPGRDVPDGEVSLVVESNPPSTKSTAVDGFTSDTKQVIDPKFFVDDRGGDFFFVPSVDTLHLWSPLTDPSVLAHGVYRIRVAQGQRHMYWELKQAWTEDPWVPPGSDSVAPRPEPGSMIPRPPGEPWVRLEPRNAQNDAQKWHIEPLGNDQYIISNVDSKLWLDHDIVKPRKYPIIIGKRKPREGTTTYGVWTMQEETIGHDSFTKIWKGHDQDHVLDARANRDFVVGPHKREDGAPNQRWLFERVY